MAQFNYAEHFTTISGPLTEEFIAAVNAAGITVRSWVQHKDGDKKGNLKLSVEGRDEIYEARDTVIEIAEQHGIYIDEDADVIYLEEFTHRRNEWEKTWSSISADTAAATKALKTLEPTLPPEVSQYRAAVESLICLLLAEIKSCDSTIAAHAADLKEHTNL